MDVVENNFKTIILIIKKFIIQKKTFEEEVNEFMEKYSWSFIQEDQSCYKNH